VASPHRCRCRSLPPDLAGQPGSDRDPAEPLPTGQGPPRPGHRQGLGPPHAPAARRDTLSCRAALRLDEVFAVDDPTGTLEAVWKVKEQLRVLLRTGSLEDAEKAKAKLEELVIAAAELETTRLYRTVWRWWKEIEVLIITGATTGKVEATNTAIKNIKRTARGYRNPANYKSVILLRSALRTAA
jgi:hypothetical protein